jgi:hypothetical protein
MRNGRALLTCGVLGAFGLALMAAETPSDQYSKAMKDIGAAAQSLNKAVPAEDFDTVAKNAAAIIEAFPVVEKYWTGKAEDAVRVVRTATKAAADLRVAAGLKSSEGVAYSAKELADACMQCHTAHRERLPDGTFQIK